MIFGLLLALAAQTSSGKLPPAGPIPAPDADEQLVMRPVSAVFAGIAARDPAAINAQLVPGGSATIVTEQPNGGRTIQRSMWPEAIGRFQPGPEKFEERLSDPAIESDGSVALVWGSYVFLIDGKVNHCGIDHFDLVRDNNGWKIANVTFSERTIGCPAQ
jgi:hypothetical protein